MAAENSPSMYLIHQSADVLDSDGEYYFLLVQRTESNDQLKKRQFKSCHTPALTQSGQLVKSSLLEQSDNKLCTAWAVALGNFLAKRGQWKSNNLSDQALSSSHREGCSC